MSGSINALNVAPYTRTRLVPIRSMTRLENMLLTKAAALASVDTRPSTASVMPSRSRTSGIRGRYDETTAPFTKNCTPIATIARRSL